jgi:L-ascorbate metabolism protein UlaG (beta-lactamase superfamily)
MNRVTWLGHAALRIETNGHTLLIDPFFTGNPAAEKAGITADSMKADFILVSHGHADHVGDAVAIATRTGATVIANFEIAGWFEKQNVKAHGMQHGGAFGFPFGRVKMTLAFHGSMLPDGTSGGNPAGFLVTTSDGKCIYDAADTGLFGDMKLIGKEGIDLAILPIGDNYTMGPDDALRAVRMLKPTKVFPIHYDTWPPIAQDAQAWVTRVNKKTDAEAVVLKVGDWVEV